MNTFTTKKVGEVLAFARIGIDTSKKGKEGFLKILSQEDVDKIERMFKDLEKQIKMIITEQNIEKEVEEKAEETQEKVSLMRDTYIGEKWDDPSELLEWTGFYSGASLVHWKLINGAAQAMKFEALLLVSRQAIDFYDTFLLLDEKKLQKIGAESAS